MVYIKGNGHQDKFLSSKMKPLPKKKKKKKNDDEDIFDEDNKVFLGF